MKYLKYLALCLAIFTLSSFSWEEDSATLKLALLKYNGGGDWYSNPTSLPNLAAFCNEVLGTDFDTDYAVVEVGSAEIFNYPFIHMTGHGNVVFSDTDAANLRNYLIAGGFLHIDDNYGMDRFVRVAMKKVFPEQEFVELPFEHEVYRQEYTFKDGLPKIHKHDEEPSRGFGIFWEGRLVCFYSVECDLGDGWEDEEVHNDPPEVRLQALKMGANLVQYAFQQ
ncbi:MAG TPA: DUF4159 domain-containing protein [Saprospiraceae bacterium]|nr:DUF4159 domain-containing protein [Saprospiraceae bacterium]